MLFCSRLPDAIDSDFDYKSADGVGNGVIDQLQTKMKVDHIGEQSTYTFSEFREYPDVMPDTHFEEAFGAEFDQEYLAKEREQGLASSIHCRWLATFVETALEKLKVDLIFSGVYPTRNLRADCGMEMCVPSVVRSVLFIHQNLLTFFVFLCYIKMFCKNKIVSAVSGVG